SGNSGSVSVLLGENSGNVVFNGVVGGVTPLASLTVAGTATINTATVKTSGPQAFNGDFILGTDATLTGSTVTVASPKAINLLLASSGTAAINTFTVVGNLNLSGIQAGTLSFISTFVGTSGAHQFGHVVNIGGSATIRSGASLSLIYAPGFLTDV